MPFTLAHPIAVVPFSRLLGRRVPLTALVIGSIVPDVEHLLGGRVEGIGHTVMGLGLFSLPVGLAIFILYEYLLRAPLVALAPPRLARRLQRLAAPRRLTDIRALLVVSAAIVFGAVTHLILDAFTHYGGWFVQRSPFLQSVAIETGDIQLVWYKLIQYLSAPVGCGLLLIWGIAWYRAATPQRISSELTIPTVRRRAISGLIIAIGLAASVATVLLQLRNTDIPLYAQVALVRGAMAGMSAFAISLLAYAVVFRIFGSAIREERKGPISMSASVDAPAPVAQRPDVLASRDRD